jgi:hypothetical protein
MFDLTNLNQYIITMSTTNKGKLNISILIPIVLIVVISIVVYIFLTQKEKTELTAQTQQERITKIKEDLITLLPGKYQVIEDGYEEPSAENDGCVSIFTIFPKEYTEIQKEYLDPAGLIYCEDINTAILRGQVDQVKYNQAEDKWIYEDTQPLETKMYGDNLVSTVALGGSHALSDYHIVRVEDSKELIILSIPVSNRIRCDTYENGVEIMKDDCVDFRDTLKIPSEEGDWVPDEIYKNYYNDLLDILSNINSVDVDTNGKDSYQEWLESEADRIVKTFDFSTREIKPLIQIPEYKFETSKDTIEKEYRLSSNDIVSVNCSKLESEFSPIYDIHGCDISLNSEEVLGAWSWTDNKTIDPHITIYDNEKLKYPLIAVGEQFGPANRDDLSVYRIVDGKLVNLMFESQEETKKTWFVDPYTKMYVEDEKEYLVTYFHDPAMIEKSLTRVWEVNEKDLKLIETILERGF